MVEPELNGVLGLFLSQFINALHKGMHRAIDQIRDTFHDFGEIRSVGDLENEQNSMDRRLKRSEFVALGKLCLLPVVKHFLTTDQLQLRAHFATPVAALSATASRSRSSSIRATAHA